MPKGPLYTHFHERPDEWKRPGETIDSIIGDGVHNKDSRDKEDDKALIERLKRENAGWWDNWRIFTYAVFIILIIDYVLLSVFLMSPMTTLFLNISFLLSGIFLVFALIWAFKTGRYDKWGLLVVIFALVPFLAIVL